MKRETTEDLIEVVDAIGTLVRDGAVSTGNAASRDARERVDRWARELKFALAEMQSALNDELRRRAWDDAKTRWVRIEETWPRLALGAEAADLRGRAIEILAREDARWEQEDEA